MHLTTVLICHGDALGQLTWITDHSQRAIEQRIAQARSQCRFHTHLNRAEIRHLDRHTHGTISKIFDRTRSKNSHTGKPEGLFSGFRQRNKPNSKIIEHLESIRIVDPGYQQWLILFIEAVKKSPHDYSLFVR